MAEHDRLLLEQAAISRAAAGGFPPNPPPKEKPTSQGYALTVAQIVSSLSSISLCVAVFIGIFPHAANAKPLSYALPFIAAPVLGFGMAAAWHWTMNVAAHAHELLRKILAAVCGVFLTCIGIGTSAWFFVAIMGGDIAMQTYQRQALERLKLASEAIMTNAASDAPLLAAVENGSGSLRTAATSEDRAGVVARRGGGKGGAYRGLSDASDNMAKVATAMRQRKAERDALLISVQNSLSDAETGMESGTRESFEEAFAKARTALAAVDKMRLASDASGLGIGWAVDQTAAPFVAGTVQDIQRISQRVETIRVRVTLPTFQAISEQEAVRINPPVLAWVAGIMIETLPLAMLALLLLLWREQEWPTPIYLPLRSNQQPAE